MSYALYKNIGGGYAKIKKQREFHIKYYEIREFLFYWCTKKK